MRIKARIDIQILHTDTGIWCDQCLLPSAVKFHIGHIASDGIHVLGWKIVCTECEVQQ